jgi:cell pole-organizing protein PopZ
MPPSNESSVEEILESIKKVIARDNREGAMDARRRRLTEFEDSQNGFGAADVGDAEEVLDLAEMEFEEDLDTNGSVRDDFDEDHGEFEDESLEQPLTTEAVRSSMRDNFAALAMLAQPGAQPQIVRSGETSLEGMVRDMLRPMLAEWMDKNLPTMVEKMVQAEIARIAGKKR